MKSQSQILFVGLVASLLSAMSAFAGETSYSVASPSSDFSAAKPLWIFGGVAGGGATLDSNEYLVNPRGGQFMASGLLSLYSSSLVADLGVNWWLSQLEGKLKNQKIVEMKTRSATAELSPRYRFNENWSFGPTVHFNFGTDTGFAPEQQSNQANWLGGAKLAFDIPMSSVNLRLIGMWLTDLGIANRTAQIFMGGIQFGLPVISKSRVMSPAVEDRVSVIQSAPAPQPVKKQVKLTLSAKEIHFPTGSAKLSSEAQSALRKIGQFLAQNDSAWSALEIGGHTDSRGKFNNNLKLSQKRAEAVMNSLIDGGVNSAKLNSEGFGPSRPLVEGSSDLAFAKNRRVELTFKDVKNPEKFESQMQVLKEGI